MRQNRANKQEVARSLLDFAIDRDEIIILETEMLESPDVNRTEHLGRIRDQAIKNANTLRKVLTQI